MLVVQNLRSSAINLTRAVTNMGAAEAIPNILDDSYKGYCACCGDSVEFIRKHRSLREGYSCPKCRSSLRYRGQSEVLVELFGKSNDKCLADLAVQTEFSRLSIYEPGLSGPFRVYMDSLPAYQNSFFWDTVEPGDKKDGVRCENLEKLTFADDSIDLMISSDILEHVRRPMDAFSDIYRVLKPGGWHVFSIPVQLPMRTISNYRVDTTTDEDILIDEAHYHGDGIGGRSLVYVDYGADLVGQLLSIGYSVYLHKPSDDNPEAQRLLTFATRKK